MLSTFKRYFNIIAVSFMIGSTAIFFVQNRKIKNLNSELASVTNNSNYYEALAAAKDSENRTLQLTSDQLATSKDSIIQQLNEVKKKLKIKDKELESAHVINTEVKDTTSVDIKTKDIDFTKEVILNPLTKITVIRKDSVLTTLLDLKNQQILFIEEKKEYRRKYKNGWRRFWKFDFKKDNVKRYQIENSNNLIKVTDTRVIELKK